MDRPLVLTLEGAAQALQIHPETLRQAAARQQLPASRRFGRWYFLPADLEEWIRAGYAEKWKAGEGMQWQDSGNGGTQTGVSASGENRGSGGLTSPAREASDYAKALGQATSSKPESTGTRSRPKRGASKRLGSVLPIHGGRQ